MKKISIILAALATAFAVSCNKEAADIDTTDPSVPTGMKEVTISASIDDTATKTSYDAAGKFSWTKGDQISILCSDGQFYTFTASSSAASTSFIGSIPVEESLSTYAFYPADSGHKKEGGSFNFSIPTYKDLSSSNSADIPMVGESNDGVYAFKHCAGAAKITFINVPDFCEYVEVSVKTLKLKVSGNFGVYKDSGDPTYWRWSLSYGGSYTSPAGPDSELIFTRKVKVEDNTAIIYLPWVWGSGNGLRHESTVDVVGFDSADTSYELLSEKTMAALGDFNRAEIKVLTPLELPTYIPPVDWTKVDWTQAAVASETGTITDLEYYADQYYVYARLKGSVTALQTLHSTPADRLTLFLYDALDGSGNGFWGNYAGSKGNTEYEVSTLFADGYQLNISVANNSVSSDAVISDDIVTWRFAFPRSIDILKNSGKVYIGFMPQDANGNARGSIPAVSKSLLEVTLP